MGIDRIGNGMAPGATSPTDSSAVSSSPGAEPFQVPSVQASSTAQPLSLVDRLESGELTIYQYLDLRVEQATAHLVGQVSNDQLLYIRHNLRTQLEGDPALLELVRVATHEFTKSIDRD